MHAPVSKKCVFSEKMRKNKMRKKKPSKKCEKKVDKKINVSQQYSLIGSTSKNNLKSFTQSLNYLLWQCNKRFA